MSLSRAIACWMVLAGAGLQSQAVRPDGDPAWATERLAMVRDQLRARGIHDPRVLAAMEKVPRHLFIPEAWRSLAYGDHPVSVGPGRAILQPRIAALQLEALGLKGWERVLEVGAGPGYLAALSAHLASDVYGVESEADLYRGCRERLDNLGLHGIHLRCGENAEGWPEAAPFDAILISASSEDIPGALWDQLRPGGRMLLPLGPDYGVQELVLVTKGADGSRTIRKLLPVMFPPLRVAGVEGFRLP